MAAKKAAGKAARKPASGKKAKPRAPAKPAPRGPGVAYWLAKSEPDVYSIDQLARDGRTLWTGVRNHRARNIMRDEMRPGDLVLFYHSNADPSAAVGIMRVAGPAQPDPTQFDAKLADMGYDPRSTRDAPTWWAADVEFAEKLATPVTLADVKANKKLAQMALVRISQLSVQPVTAAEWAEVMRMAGRA